jgi:hypothetical protein
MVRFVLFVHCPLLPARFGVPVLLVDVPVEVVNSYIPSSRRPRRASLPSMSFLDWVLSGLRARGVALPSHGWFFVRRAVEVRRPLPLPLVVLG